MKSSTSGSVEFVWKSLDRLSRPIRLLPTYRTSEDRLWDKRRSPQTSIFTCDELNWWISNLYDNLYLASFERKFITERPLAVWNCFLVGFSWLVRRILSSTSDPTDDLNLIGVWPRPDILCNWYAWGTVIWELSFIPGGRWRSWVLVPAPALGISASSQLLVVKTVVK